jgi:hypothetical protein
MILRHLKFDWATVFTTKLLFDKMMKTYLKIEKVKYTFNTFWRKSNVNIQIIGTQHRPPCCIQKCHNLCRASFIPPICHRQSRVSSNSKLHTTPQGLGCTSFKFHNDSSNFTQVRAPARSTRTRKQTKNIMPPTQLR